jgi:hypothetical protein
MAKVKVFKVQKQVAMKGVKTAAGQKVTTIGKVWETIAVKRNKATAERTAQGLRIDNPDGIIQIVEATEDAAALDV